MSKIEVRKFDNVRFRGDWEHNYIGKKWNLRIGRSQVALWRTYKGVPINLFHPYFALRQFLGMPSKRGKHD